MLGVAAGGAGPEDLTDTINNLLAYDGKRLVCCGCRHSCSHLAMGPIWHMPWLPRPVLHGVMLRICEARRAYAPRMFGTSTAHNVQALSDRLSWHHMAQVACRGCTA